MTNANLPAGAPGRGAQPAHRTRVRFAPAPAGYLHVGNVRPALFNYLYARRSGGTFILRIEDTDRVRSSHEYEQCILEDLLWLGLEWDEGPTIGGPHAPYRQSERTEVYREHLNALITRDRVYRCYCTQPELDARRAAARLAGRPPIYDRRCAELADIERADFEKEGRPFTWRYRVPARKVIIDDLVRGHVEFNTGLIGDTVIWKSDDTPAFHLATTVDDALMDVACVLRGEGQMPNTPIQILLATDLGFAPSQFAHISQALSPGGGKLSRHSGAWSLRRLRERGYLPEAVANFIALLGWPAGGREVFTLEEAARIFQVKDLSKAAVTLDPKRLSHISRAHMRRATPARLAALAWQVLEEAGLHVEEEAYLVRLCEFARLEAEKIEDFPSILRPFIVEPEPDEAARNALAAPGAREVMEAVFHHLSATGRADAEEVKSAMAEASAATGRTGHDLYAPVRAALIGSVIGAQVAEIVPVLGLERALARLHEAVPTTAM